MNDDSNSIAGVSRVRQDEWLRRMSYRLVALQLVAAPAILFSSFLPPVIGIGSFSTSVDLRIINAILAGLAFSLLVLASFIFAWAGKPVYWRALRCGLLLCWVGLSTGGLLFFQGFNAGFNTQLELIFEVFAFFMLVGVGIVIVPFGMRCWRGWQVAELKSEKIISRQEAVVEWVAFAILVGFIFNSNSLIESGLISSAIGISIGVVLCGFAFWILRVNSANWARVAFMVCAVLFVLVPGVFVWLADYSSLSILPAATAGSGYYFWGLLSGALVLLVHVVIFRARGLRMQRFAFEKSAVEVGEKVVVDPFSD